MKLTAREILKLLGFDIPEDGVKINPEDAHYHQVMLELLGTTISPAAINEAAFAQVSHANANDPDRAITRTQYATVMKNVYGFSHVNSSEQRPAPMGNEALSFSNAQMEPLKVEVIEDIPFTVDDVLFIDMQDQPGRDVVARICRANIKAKAFCFIGFAPDWGRELMMIGQRAYELPAGTVLAHGRRAFKPYPSSVGERWIEVRVGAENIQFN